MDCTLLRDSELLCHHLKDVDKIMTCTAVVVLGEIREPAVLAKLVVRGTEGVLNAVFDALGSEDDGTRYEMFIELCKIAKHGDARVIAVLIAIMNSATLPSIRTEIL